MKEIVKHYAEYAAFGLEFFGIAIIVGYILIATLLTAWKLAQGKREKVYSKYRQFIGQGILLGLEVLVAADIILTVVVDYDLRSVGVLALIVLVRTFLSFTLEAEISGHWPWQQQNNSN